MMIIKRKSTCFVALFGLFAGSAMADPLFESDDLLEVTIRAPFETIMGDRPDEDYVPGTFEYTDADGAAVVLDVGVRTRGEFRRRRDVCPFAPLRINFKKGQVKGTEFAGQDKLKLVTHCRSGHGGYEQSVLGEYLAYRILNAVTDNSFRVRLMRVTYAYTDDSDEKQSYAFFIEHKDRLAKRLDRDLYEPAETEISELDAENLNLTSVFQYLIGNTDFSPVAARPDEHCCHNYVLFGEPPARVLSIPYDFDQSGLADAPHANPNPRFGLRSVQDRLYRGRCVNNHILESSYQAFRDQRDHIYGLIDTTPGMSNKYRKQHRKYVESFYEVIDNPRRADMRFTRACI